jgi:hypothetical protein
VDRRGSTQARARGRHPEQAGELLPHVDWAQAESCFSQGWCAALAPFVEAGKPVVVIEYTDDPMRISLMCRDAATLRFSLLVKKRELDAFRRECSEGAIARGL